MIAHQQIAYDLLIKLADIESIIEREKIVIETLDSLAIKYLKTTEDSCSVCGSNRYFIRGRYPGNAERVVCPTCLQEKIDDFRERTAPGYGIAVQEKWGR